MTFWLDLERISDVLDGIGEIFFFLIHLAISQTEAMQLEILFEGCRRKRDLSATFTWRGWRRHWHILNEEGRKYYCI